MAILTRRQVYDLARVAGLDHEAALMATAIAEGESGRNPDKVGDKSLMGEPTADGRTWGPSVGLWQVRSIDEERGTGASRDRGRLTDPAFNARAMVAISGRGLSWSPWTIWKNGIANRLLPAVRAEVEGGSMAANVRGGDVLPHVQAFADAVKDAAGVDSFGTYAGHEPTLDRALDIFVPVDDPGPAKAVCDFALEHFDHYGLMYVISRQRIYNPSKASYWRGMEDRGSLTQNHFDHVHISFLEEGAASPSDQEDELTEEQNQLLHDIATGLAEIKTNVFIPLDPTGKGGHIEGMQEFARIVKGQAKK